ncbi:N-acetylmuramoyl-L-alanine amidase [Pseudomarimonas salicorniae]|uniref:N-acetylmuramoyl-L-alanine amidase n=1 Tax=Pseudomarimonas salicorniae TaxID=2933270 RepID=UPI003CCCA46F
MPDAPPTTIEIDPLPYETRLEARPTAAIRGVVIHCTETPDLARARRIGEEVRYPSGTGNSGHYYIDLDGRTLRYVAPERIAHHVRGHNADSIGIELVNRGRYPHWLHADHQAMDTPYTPAQIAALRRLLAELESRLPTLEWIAGHEDLDREQVPAADDPSRQVPRKRDPGPMFPWDEVLAGSRLRRVGE